MLAVAFTVFVLATVLTGLVGRRDAGTVDDVMRVTGPIIGVGFGLSGVAALGLALRALIARHERSFLVWLALALGLCVAVFLLGEVLVPH